VTTAEVHAQQQRDQAADAEGELRGLAASLELPAQPAEAPLAEEDRAGLEARIERLARRREQLGPVNPLAQEEYTEAVAHVEELVGQLFPGGRGRLRLVREEEGPRRVLGGADDGSEETEEEPADQDELLGVEIEMTPAGKSMKRLSLLSGGEKSLTALAFLFAVFLARPCPFYVLDEVEAALDDLNIDRFLRLLRRYAQRAQFIVVTHQKRT